MLNLRVKPFYLNDQGVEWVEKTLLAMTVDEKIEQLFCPLMFTYDPNVLRGLISHYKFGAVMFRSGDAHETQAAINALQSTSKIPLLVAANLEDGGNGIVENGTYMGRQMLVAATDNEEKAYQLGKICGNEGKAIGANWAFSPVVDIDLCFRNPITNVRTFGSDPNRVLKMGKKYIQGLVEEGVIPSIKHFPGDGVDERDQHLVTSVNTLSIEEWEKSFGKIYRELIEDGAMTTMIGHIAMPSMEEYFDQKACTEVIPASVSKNIITGYLRGEIGFNGLITTDASPMVGLTAATQRKQAVPLTIENGCDMFLFTKDLEEDITFMKEGYREGVLSASRLDEAVTRILATKAAIGLPEKAQQHTLDMSVGELDKIQSAEHIQWAKECADQGITLVKDTQGLLPISSKTHKRVLLQIIGDFSSNKRVYEQFESLLCAEGFELTKYIPETMETIFSDTKVIEFKNKYDLVMYIGNIENASNKTVSRIHWHTLFGAGNNIPWFAKEVPTLFVSVGNPYHLLDVPMVKTYINGYCHSPYVIEYVVDKLMGRSPFKGINPVDPFCGLWDTRL